MKIGHKGRLIAGRGLEPVIEIERVSFTVTKKTKSLNCQREKGIST